MVGYWEKIPRIISMKKIIEKILDNIFPLFLLVIVILFFLLNYKTGTFLSGWDNLHPEFDFGLNVKRSIFSAWQEYQGLGLLGGMGHASDLPRQIFLWLVSFVLPRNFLRYFYHFLMLLLGPLGVYFLLKEIIFRDSEGLGKNLACLIGAVFYLLNLATVQMFYSPFEPFSHHFAFLPWLFLANLNFLEKGSKVSLFFLLLISFLAVPQGYVLTLFLVWLCALSLVFLIYWLGKKDKESLKRIIIAYLSVLTVNFFWLLPNIYFVVTNREIPLEAKNNFMSSEDSLYKNKKYGDLNNSILLKGFWFDNKEVGQNGRQIVQMGDWVEYTQKPFFKISGYLLFSSAVLGLIYGLYQNNKRIIYFVPLGVFSFILLASEAPVFSAINRLFYQLPLVGQVFRFPFTKFSLILALCLAIFIANSVVFWLAIIKNKLRYFVLVIFLFLIFIVGWPVFKGSLFYQKEKTVFPEEYFKVFNYFKTQPLGRIANFPQYSFWGWSFYDFNYSGSGFLWYGIKQPILDRAFDVWSRQNENYYWEITDALYSQNLLLLENISEKYQISWLLLDGNVVSYASPKSLYLDELQSLISNSSKIKLATSFGKIKIYQVDLKSKPKDFVFIAENLPQVGPVYKWNNFDQAFVDSGYYISLLTTNNQPPNTIYYPFRSLFTDRRQEELEFKVEDRGSYFSFQASLPKDLENGLLLVPKIDQKELTEVDPNDLSKIKIYEPKIYLDKELISIASGSATNLSYINKGDLEIQVPKVTGLFSYDSALVGDLWKKEKLSCDNKFSGKFSLEKLEENNQEFLRFGSLDNSSCLDLLLPSLENRLSYLIAVESRYQKGKSILFWLENLNSRHADLETYLPKSNQVNTSYFIQPAMELYGLGYSLHFNNISIGKEETINDLFRVTVNPIPYRFLTGIKIVKSDIHLPGVPQAGRQTSQPRSTAAQPHLEGGGDIKVSHPNEGFYKVEIPGSTQPFVPNTSLILSQAYSKDWLAFQLKIYNWKLKINFLPHVLINNWENGWQLPTTNHQSPITVYIFFWPQILEYLGFVLLLTTPFVIWKVTLDKQNTKVI